MDVTDAIEQRRSYRALAPVEVTDGMVRDLAKAASLAPSCFNNQPWRLIFIRSKDMLARMHAALSEGNEWARDASMLIVVASRKELDCVIREREYYLFDTGLAIGQMMLAAVDLGLVTHAMAGFSPRKTREILDMPEDMAVITVIAVGRRSNERTTNISDDQWDAEDDRPARLEFPEYAYLERYS